MTENITIIAAVKPLHYQGKSQLGDNWLELLQYLRSLMQHNGFETQESKDELLIFTYNHPYPAIISIFSAISAIKRKFQKTAPDHAVPFHFILHLPQPGEINSPFLNPDSSPWKILKTETIYISRPLKLNWEALMTQKKFPNSTLQNEGDGIFMLKFTESFDFPENNALLSFRSMSIKGGLEECFYCGLKTHKPKYCPSKFITMENNSLVDIGYLPFAKINMVYKNLFDEQEELIAFLAAGLKPGQSRKNAKLLTFLSYLDINRVYQPRFLFNITFSTFNNWESAFDSKKLSFENNNLRLALDCLRVQQYSQAEEIFLKESGQKSPKRFYAKIGLAFVALERDRRADMRTHLEIANDLAILDKERIYIALLLSRLYCLTNENWHAKEVLANVFSLKKNCQETNYRKIQLEAQEAFDEYAFQHLRAMVADDRQIFMSALLDPAFIKVESKIENILSAQYNSVAQRAETNLSQANYEIEDLTLWFDDDDKQMHANLKTIENLKARFERKSYFDLLDVASKAAALLSAAKKLKVDKLNELFDEANQALELWSEYDFFWNRYDHQRIFNQFGKKLQPLEKKIKMAIALAKKNKGKTYRQAIAELNDVQLNMGELEKLRSKMLSFNQLCHAGKIFGKRLLVCETLIALILPGIIVAGSTGLLPEKTLTFLSELISDSWTQKRAILFASTLLAPFLAFFWTMITLSKPSD